MDKTWLGLAGKFTELWQRILGPTLEREATPRRVFVLCGNFLGLPVNFVLAHFPDNTNINYKIGQSQVKLRKQSRRGESYNFIMLPHV